MLSTPETTKGTTSAQNRVSKKFSLYLESAGGTYTGGGLAGAYFLNSNSMIVVDANGYSNSLTDELVNAISGIRDEVSGSSIGVHYKHFFGNSFFVRVGAEQREVTMKRTYEPGLFVWFPDNGHSSFKGTSTNAVLGIGNDWQWDNFTLGFDWIRFYSPIAHDVTSEDYSSSEELPSLRSRERDLLDRQTAMTGFHFGASF